MIKWLIDKKELLDEIYNLKLELRWRKEQWKLDKGELTDRIHELEQKCFWLEAEKSVAELKCKEAEAELRLIDKHIGLTKFLKEKKKSLDEDYGKEK